MNEMLDPRKTFGEAVIEAAKKNPDIVVLSADSGSGSGLKDFPSLFPGRHFEFGIMEQGIMGYASGLATTGKIPVFAAIAPFVTARPFEMFRNDLGYMNQNVKVVGRCASLTYNQLGATHHSIDDVAIIRTIPGVTIINPGDPVTIKKGVNAMIEHTGPCYMKIGSPKMPVLYPEDIDFRLGKGIIVKDGRDVALIGTGTVLSKAFIAARLLEEAGISVRLIDIHTIKPLDRELILSTASDIGRIVTVEEHFITGGLGSTIAELCSQEYPVKMKMIGIGDQYASNGPYEELLGKYGLQPEQIKETVIKFLNTK
ncbi:MAG TPA: transketolase C-terminal domain-containing protein [Bacteroidales bacterium]|nr:transketolase C-terminal domain-containing protein [Bacteroidales bacterium]HPR74218.1 transketolase C-terminal domain-containing protein [Bacteroidales bacterium]HRX94464.1 transketolase C-terminal domain-containing protein [Chitinophagaceae bacterium]